MYFSNYTNVTQRSMSLSKINCCRTICSKHIPIWNFTNRNLIFAAQSNRIQYGQFLYWSQTIFFSIDLIWFNEAASFDQVQFGNGMHILPCAIILTLNFHNCQLQNLKRQYTCATPSGLHKIIVRAAGIDIQCDILLSLSMCEKNPKLSSHQQHQCDIFSNCDILSNLQSCMT